MGALRGEVILASEGISQGLGYGWSRMAFRDESLSWFRVYGLWGFLLDQPSLAFISLNEPKLFLSDLNQCVIYFWG